MKDITFTIIKPNAVEAGNTDRIFSMIRSCGFRIVARRLLLLTKEQAERFYGIHAGKPFFDGLVDFMTSGPVEVAVLQRDDAVAELRRLAGNTDPAEAADGTIRKLYGETVRRNAVHASDSNSHAREEALQFFSEKEIYG